jgi:farnesyl diphosphate synthase
MHTRRVEWRAGNVDDEKVMFQKRLSACAAQIDACLNNMLTETPRDGEIARPPRLIAAMRHGVLNGGKRLRPFLLVETAAMFGMKRTAALNAAAALECLHCYSLIHDDLPVMDNDDLRRGQPTVHRAFDEATAILAGDSLLTFAFEILASSGTHSDPAIRIELVAMLARASGMAGMAGGQMLDLENEARTLQPEEASLVQQMKTAALIRFACEAGAVLAGASRRERAALAGYGESIGKAFQLADDILDITASAETLGKQTAKDSERGKATLVSIIGLKDAIAMKQDLLRDARAQLAQFGERAQLLHQAAYFIVHRDH